ncbi:MAG: hypothetical protein BA863_10670 [Desulfovibrio sp. S3730MH75]|nr:MAG: hypothetical protein BA863_10670 [Desulfovibrio sp. S3730MH75]
MYNYHHNFSIFDENPTDWKDLQWYVAKLLNEVGFNAEVERKIESVRGTVEIDVYAEEQTTSGINRIIVECKFWESNIPQEKIHALRTVSQDLGINKAYFVAKKGFQSGAHVAAQHSIIELLSYNEFITLFKKQWYESFLKDYHKKLNDLKKYDRLNEALGWQVGHPEGFSNENFRNSYTNLLENYSFLFRHLTLLEQQVRLNTGGLPSEYYEFPEIRERYKEIIGKSDDLIQSSPTSVIIDKKAIPLNTYRDLHDLVYKHKVIDIFIDEIEGLLSPKPNSMS